MKDPVPLTPRTLGVSPRTGPTDAGVVDALARELDADVATAGAGIVQRLAPEEVVGGIATRSYVAVMDEARRAALSTGVRQLLADHPGTRGRTPIELPYVTRAYRLTLAERAQGQQGRFATANTRRKGSTVVPSGRGG